MKIKNSDINNFVVNLQCKNCKTCPDISIETEKDLVTLSDDHGNENRWTMENFKEFVKIAKDGVFDHYLD